ncbi:MAG TPA: HRDC domain-containing protein, partial [Gemmatimonadales bacterium]|nr:HRDC domain-containing protein [Gemmatimonadales bacterium]
GGGGGASDSDEEAYLRVKGAKALRPRDLAAFRELYAWREAVAQREDKAPFRIIGNDPLLAVSRALPETAVALAKVVGLPPSLARRHGPALLEAVHRARALPEAELPRLVRPPRGPKDPKVDERVEKLKAARNRVAGELGLDPGVLCGRTTLEAVARAAPKDRAGLATVGELRRWQFDVLGDALLAALA